MRPRHYLHPLLLALLHTACAIRVSVDVGGSPKPVSRRDVVSAGCAITGVAGCAVTYDALPSIREAAAKAASVGAAERLGATKRAASVFCNGPLLDAVQRANLFGDSKYFVDCPLKVEPEEALQRFAQLPAEPSTAQLRAFVHDNFDRPGVDLVPWAPVDYAEAPPKLAQLHDENLRDWALSLNKFWSQLGRATSAEAAESPHKRTLLPLPYPFVVPGGRFVETYYWDSYWIVKGLLTCGMRETATGMVRNLLHLVDKHGFVPNGGRLYYLNRSQPPLLSECVRAVMEDGFDLSLLRDSLPLLRKEYDFWMQQGVDGHAVKVPLLSGGRGVLNRYVTAATQPRPESYLEDLETASHADVHASEQPRVFAEIAAAAESGWDFSSRWMDDGVSLHTARTSEILPVDLNSVMYRFECNLQQLHAMAGEGGNAAHYAAAAVRRQRAMSELLWNERTRQWLDFHLPTGAPLVAQPASASNWLPLWAGCAEARQTSLAVRSLRHSGLLQAGGVATTLAATEHQWDWPNAWAPLQEMLVEGLDSSGSPAGERLALRVARDWTGSNLQAWQRTHYMHEKYSAVDRGMGGGGGEYTPQVGFGWSNGVALSLLARYGDALAA